MKKLMMSMGLLTLAWTWKDYMVMDWLVVPEK
jgi:hypothetical protein